MSRDPYTNLTVHLPRMKKVSMVALAWQILSAAAAFGDKLPGFIERARKGLLDKLEMFKSATQLKVLPEPWNKVQLSRNLNDAWGSLFAWIAGMIGMPEEGAPPDLPPLRTLNTMIFADGLTFLKSSHREKWLQSEERLKAVDTAYEQAINNGGGAAFLAPLREAHRIFGEAQGFTAPLQVVENPEATKRFREMTKALRTYIGKVLAYAESEEPGAEELTQTLLVPLAQWKDTPQRSKHDEDEESSDEIAAVTEDRSLPASEAASE